MVEGKDKDKMVVKETTPMGASSAPHDHEHERTDVNIKAIMLFMGILTVAAIVIHIALWGLFNVYEEQAALGDEPPSPVADRNPLPPQPRLQPSPPQNLTEPEEMRMMREHNRKMLHEHGWIDKPSGVARIPIDSAIDRLVLQRGMRDLGRGESITPARRPDTIEGGAGRGPTDTMSVRMPGGQLEKK